METFKQQRLTLRPSQVNRPGSNSGCIQHEMLVQWFRHQEIWGIQSHGQVETQRTLEATSAIKLEGLREKCACEVSPAPGKRSLRNVVWDGK